MIESLILLSIGVIIFFIVFNIIKTRKGHRLKLILINFFLIGIPVLAFFAVIDIPENNEFHGSSVSIIGNLIGGVFHAMAVGILMVFLLFFVSVVGIGLLFFFNFGWFIGILIRKNNEPQKISIRKLDPYFEYGIEGERQNL